MPIEGLSHITSISPRCISEKRSAYYLKTIIPTRFQEFEKDGWEIVPGKKKRSIRICKAKPHNVAFEDRIWALFAKMRFEYLNSNRNFRIEYQPGIKKQVDVFSSDPESVLVVECKSVESPRKVTYQKDINELIGLKEKLRLAIKKLLPGDRKIGFIFATNNSILVDNDAKRLKEAGIFHFSQDDIDYYEQITEHLGPAAKYQLFGRLFYGQKIPELKNRVPAIKGKMSSGDVFYSFSIEPEFLLRIGFILHRTETNKETSLAYQRLVKKARLNKIAKFIDLGGFFPNSIIINIFTTRGKELKFDESKKIPHDSYTKPGVLHLPQTYRSAFIIDGQHRLYGYSRAKSSSHHTVPIVAFHNLPIEKQAKIFIDINQTQKSIPANLLASIMADFSWGSSNERQAIHALKTKMFVDMNHQADSPFFKRIIISEERQTGLRCLTLKSLLDWGLNKTEYFGKLKGDRLIKTGYLTDVSNEKTLQKAKEFINACFDKIKNDLRDQWDRGKAEGGFIAMNIGVAAVIRTLDSILEFMVKQKGLKPEDMSGKEIASAVIPYLDPAIEYIKRLDQPALKKFRAFFGSGATEKVIKEFQNAINSDFGDFKPEGLEQWKKESSGQYTTEAITIGNQHIQPLVDEFIKNKMIKEYGEKKWWFEIPEKVRLDCVKRKEQACSPEDPWRFLDTIHYKEIIEAQWQLLGNDFTPPGMENESKKRKLDWLVRFNDVRNKYSHFQRGPVTEEECTFLKDTYSWLRAKLSH